MAWNLRPLVVNKLKNTVPEAEARIVNDCVEKLLFHEGVEFERNDENDVVILESTEICDKGDLLESYVQALKYLFPFRLESLTAQGELADAIAVLKISKDKIIEIETYLKSEGIFRKVLKELGILIPEIKYFIPLIDEKIQNLKATNKPEMDSRFSITISLDTTLHYKVYLNDTPLDIIPNCL
jgi:hypothetical protein